MSQLFHCQKHILSDKRWKSTNNLQQITNTYVWHAWLLKCRTYVCQSSPRASISWTKFQFDSLQKYNAIVEYKSIVNNDISIILAVSKKLTLVQKTNFIYIYFHFPFFSVCTLYLSFLKDFKKIIIYTWPANAWYINV